jgi:hypothetical protein
MLRYQCEFFRAGVACYEGAMELSRMKKGSSSSTPAKKQPETAPKEETPPPSMSLSSFLADAVPQEDEVTAAVGKVTVSAVVPTPAPAPAPAIVIAAPVEFPPAAPADGVVLVQAVSSFAGTNDVDLSFQAGDVLLMTSRVLRSLSFGVRTPDFTNMFRFPHRMLVVSGRMVGSVTRLGTFPLAVSP